MNRWTLLALTFVALLMAGSLGLRSLTSRFSDVDAPETARRLMSAADKIGVAETKFSRRDGRYAYDGANGSAVTQLTDAGHLGDDVDAPASAVRSGASWTVTQTRNAQAPVVAIELDGSRDSTAAVCREVEQAGNGAYGCSQSLDGIGAGATP